MTGPSSRSRTMRPQRFAAGSAAALLAEARLGLAEASAAATAHERYAAAHRAALRATAAVLAARARPAGRRRAGRAASGCCSPRSRPSSSSGRRSSPPAPASGPPPRRGSPGGDRPRGRRPAARRRPLPRPGRDHARPDHQVSCRSPDQRRPRSPADRLTPPPPSRMSGDPFVHLHVASGYSLRHGASHPGALVARAAEHGMDTLALTDRDGVYGAVKFVKAAVQAGVRRCSVSTSRSSRDRRRRPYASARPSPRARARRGGVAGPRVTVRPGPRGYPCSTLLGRRRARAGRRSTGSCPRPTSRGRARPAGSAADLVAEHAARGELLVLLGPDSEVGRALALRRPDLARAALDRWRDASTRPACASRWSRTGGPGRARLERPRRPAARVRPRPGPHRGADQHRPLRRAVRRRDRRPARRRPAARRPRPAARRPGQRRGLPQARQGDGRRGGRGVPAGRRCRRHRGAARGCSPRPGPRRPTASSTRARDLGLGAVHLPELAVVDGSGAAARSSLRQRCEAALAQRTSPGAPRRGSATRSGSTTSSG